MRLSVLALAALLGAACGSKPPKAVAPAPPRAEVARPASERVGPRATETAMAGEASVEAACDLDEVLSPVYFEYDSALLSAAGRDVLARVAECLEAHPKAKLTISGHADERGPPEYNIALGQERADAARDYLVRLGVDPGRVKTISYGEERPAASGSGEDVWARNRRDELSTRRSP